LGEGDEGVEGVGLVRFAVSGAAGVVEDLFLEGFEGGHQGGAVEVGAAYRCFERTVGGFVRAEVAGPADGFVAGGFVGEGGVAGAAALFA
jgi:hypothetical protein